MTVARPLNLDTSLIIAGIGASAGGLEAMLQMFAKLRPNGRVAYVVAQHMAHDGHSELVVRLIGRESALPVLIARDMERLLPDTIYVIPSGRDGIVKGNTLSVQEPGPTNISTPSVNTLFTSIAGSCRKQAIAIVLSGTGYDGVAGCRAIKAQGGLTIAQDPEEARFNGMPVAAIEAGVVDKVLPVDTISAMLAERFPGKAAASLPKMSAPAAPLPPAPSISTSSVVVNSELEQLLRLVHQATKIDFSSYKEETLLRRIEKRKETLGISSFEQYLDLVRRKPEELHIIQHLFLVSLSSFFRDRASFNELERSLAGMLAEKREGEPIRVWVPGCASGEEPYTLAIIISELLGERCRRHAVQIIATDLNPEALEMARAGIYRQTAFKEMNEGVRDRYFTARGQHFEISTELRGMVCFEQRDVLTGAPPGDPLDLVSCRNLLIYMKSNLQDQLIKSFHQALRPQGLLFIGQSESLSFMGNSLFTAIDHYHRLFRRRN